MLTIRSIAWMAKLLSSSEVYTWLLAQERCQTTILCYFCLSIVTLKINKWNVFSLATNFQFPPIMQTVRSPSTFYLSSLWSIYLRWVRLKGSSTWRGTLLRITAQRPMRWKRRDGERRCPGQRRTPLIQTFGRRTALGAFGWFGFSCGWFSIVGVGWHLSN